MDTIVRVELEPSPENTDSETTSTSRIDDVPMTEICEQMASLC